MSLQRRKSNQMQVTGGGGAGSSTFVGLTDTPGAITANQFVRGNAGATALEFVALAGGGDLLADGTVPLTANWDAGSFEIRSATFESDIVTGTSPFTIASTTLVANLNADLLDGNEATAFAAASHTHLEADITDLQSYLLNITAEPLSDLSDVTITAIADGEVLRWNGAAWINNTLAELGAAPTSHTHVEADITDLGSYITVDGLTPLTGNWDVGAFTVTGTRFISDIATGTAPFGCSSTTLVTNLNADLLDGVEGSGYATAAHSHVETKAITIESPTSSEDLDMFYTDVAITVTQLTSVLRNGSSTPSVTYTIRHGTDVSAAGNEVVTGGSTVTSTTTPTEVTSFNDATVPANSQVWVETTAQSGTVPLFHVTIEYTQD